MIGMTNVKVKPKRIEILEKVSSRGFQFVDTGFTPNQDTRIVLDFQLLSDGDSRIVGTRSMVNGTLSKAFAFGTNNLGNVRTWNRGYGATQNNSTNIDVNRHTLDFNKNVVKLDTTTLATLTATTFTGFGNIYAFSYNTEEMKSHAPIWFYSMQIYDNDVLIRDFLPCKDRDGVVGLYETLEKKVYYAQGGKLYADETGIIDATNIGQYFTVANNSYYFKGSGKVFSNTNKNVNSQTAQTVLTATKNMNIRFDYGWGTEGNYDKFTITVGSTTVANNASGTPTSSTFVGTVNVGDKITFKYSKDGSAHANGDTCYFSNMLVEVIE